MQGYRDKVSEFLFEWKMENVGDFLHAGDEFFEEVNPCFVDTDTMNLMFTDWALFEYGDGKILDALAERNDEFRDVADTARYGRFFFRAVDGELCTLEDVTTGEVYEVRDDHVASKDNWLNNGTVGLHIAMHDGEWFVAGQVDLHDNSENVTDRYELFPASERNHTLFATELDFIINQVIDFTTV